MGNTNKKVLIIDSSASYRELLSRVFNEDTTIPLSFAPRTTGNTDTALDLLNNLVPDIILIEDEIPGISLASFLKSVRGKKNKNYTGVFSILLEHDQKKAAELLRQGVDGVFSKSHSGEELMAQVGAFFRLKNEIDKSHSTNEKLRRDNNRLAKLTITDELTNLNNMRYFKKRLSQEFVRAHRYDKFISLIMFDIDNFKQVNDSTNHLMGSFVLSELGVIVSDSIRSVDIGARFGGDEFVIMLPETGRVGALATARRIFDNVYDKIFDNGDYNVKVTISVGVSTFGPGEDNYRNGTELLEEADRFLYLAKAKGKATIVNKSNAQEVD